MVERASTLPVRIAKEGDRPERGTVLLAATSDHLLFKAPDRLGYTPEPKDYALPSIGRCFFQSVNLHWQGTAVGVLLTGMGRDGALGLKAMRTKGHYTIAQDQATSAVYGMPKAAAAMAAAVDILPLENIAAKLVSALGFIFDAWTHERITGSEALTCRARGAKPPSWCCWSTISRSSVRRSGAHWSAKRISTSIFAANPAAAIEAAEEIKPYGDIAGPRHARHGWPEFGASISRQPESQKTSPLSCFRQRKNRR